MRKYISISALLIILPLFVFAQTIEDVLGKFDLWVYMLLGIVSSLALLVFMWGIVKYITSAGDEDKAKEGKSIMIYGVVALFVMFSVFGLVNFVRDSFGIDRGTTITPPSINPVGGGSSGGNTGGGTTGGGSTGTGDTGGGFYGDF